MKRNEISVLMISLDPGLLDSNSGTGDALERHQRYAEAVGSLDIIVIAGKKGSHAQVSDKLRVHGVGVSGFSGALRARKMAEDIINSKQIHLVVTQDPNATGWIGSQIKRRHHILLAVGFHGDFWNNEHWKNENWKNRILDIIQKRVVKRANGIRVVSYGIRDKLLASGIHNSKIVVINTPINDEVFLDFDDKQKVLVEELRYKYGNKAVIVFAGRFVEAKNLFFLLDVCKELKKSNDAFILLLIGGGPLKGDVEDRIHEKNLDSNVRLIDKKNHRELAAYYHLAQIHVLLSTNESFGKVIIEAGMAGTPTLASETTGAQHIISDGRTGFLVPINDVESTVGILSEMIEYPEQTKQLGEWAREDYTKKYTAAKTVENVISFWESLVNHP